MFVSYFQEYSEVYLWVLQRASDMEIEMEN